MNKILLFLSLLLLVVFTAYAAETGKPFMTVYTSKEINGHTGPEVIVGALIGFFIAVAFCSL